MPIKLKKDDEQRVTASIQRFFEEHLDEEIGDLKAALVLDYVLREIGPTIYNRAITDAQTHLAERVGELDGSCYEPEFSFWKR